ncbi:MAG: dihydrofolate synthase / folylpolyglutamate synthase [Verrucomicrobiota bacterium]
MSRSSSSYTESLAWLYSLQRFGIKLGLENAHRLIAELNLDLARPIVIHVAGTNGKGSVCAMIDSISRAAGYRTGLFTSPHLVTFRERVRVNGEMISEEAVAAGLAELRERVAEWEPHPTFFEITTALALRHFEAEKVDLIVLETGLGGRLDATNAVTSNLAVITPVGLDHQKWLGKTVREIAAEKAGIIKPNRPVVSAAQQPEAQEVIRDRAMTCDAPLTFVTEPYDASPLVLRGAYQKQNAAVAVAAVRTAGIEASHAAIASGLASVEWPARFQHWDERTIIDGAHNPGAARILADTWKEVFGEQRATLILAVLDDKDIGGIIEALAPIANDVLLPSIRSERALLPDELAQALSTITPKLQYSIFPSFEDALKIARASSGPILLTGSLHFAGEALAHLRGEPAAFEECAQ